jgi:RHS repeat-associated protein
MQVANVRTVIATSAYAELDSLSSRLGSTPLYSVTMQRDKLGRITSKRESLLGNVSDFTFSYDSSGQLIDVIRDGTASEHYEYDSAGNRVRSVSTSGATVGTYDDHDRLITYGASQFSYSPAGEQALKVVGTDTTAYYYNVWGQLRSVKLPNGTTITYTFDGEGRRVGKAVNGVMVRKWLYRGPRTVIAELDGQNVLIARFVYGGQIAPEYMVRGGTTYRLLKDERGSVRAVVDATTGVAAQTMSYDAFGRVLSDSNPDFQPFGFSGGLYDAQTGLTNFDARDYDASIGRWLTLEPLSFEGGDANLYRYALADPINNIDPTGTAVVTEKATAMAVEGEVAATAATTDAAAIQIEREFTRQMRRDMCEWGANTMMAYEAWKHVKNKDGFQGHHPARQADMIRVLGSEVYDALQDWVVPIFGSAFKRGTPHYDATQAQAYAWGLGWGVTASAAYGLHAAGCSPEAIRKIMDTFLAHHKDVDLKDDQPKPND